MPTPITPEQQRALEERARCRKDKQYLSEVMGYDFVPDVHRELFDQFFKYDPTKPWAFQSETKKVLILWPRGHFKTTAVVVEIVQIILNFPDIRILLMRGSRSVTQTLLHEIKSHFTGQNSNSRIRELFPEYCEDELGNANSFTVPARKNKGLAQATVTVASPRSVKTGEHFDIGFFDDLVNDFNYRSPRLLKKVKEDFMMMLPLIDPPHYAILTGTRYAFGDLYEELIRWNKGEWKVSLKTCWADANDSVPRFPQQKSGRNPDKIIGFTREGLLLLRDSDPEMFASQYLNRPVQRGGQRFTEQMLSEALILPASAPPLSPACFFVDLAATDSETSDDSCIVVGKHDLQRKMYVVACEGGKWLPPVLAQHIIDAALVHRPTTIFFEKTASCIYFVDYLRLISRTQGVALPIEFIKINFQPDAKNIRIASLEGLIRNKQLRFFEGLERWEKIVEQFGMFPGGRNKHDDYIDTIALMAGQFGGETILQPRKPTQHPILALIAQQEQRNALSLLTERTPDESMGYDAFD